MIGLLTRIESTDPITAAQIKADILNPPQRQGWPERTQYTDAEIDHLIARLFHWCDVFGFNPLLIAAQIAHETNRLRYTGDVPFGSHNFAGLGATGGVPGHAFPDINAGVLATVAHHAVYHWGARSNWPAHLQQYAGEHVDPRYDEALSSGNAGRMHVLGDYRGTWAVPGRTYPESIIAVAGVINSYPTGDPPMPAQIPGFTWVAADGRHHTKGRTQPIRGGAQHYTAGTNSLAWLTTSPNSDVSSTFLVKHNPTPDDRGWQLVRIEDTPHTTGAIVNPFTVSIEYEHMQNQDIPDIAYECLALTWADATRYVREHGLGDIVEIKGHRDWTGGGTICPDGIDVNRIIRRWRELLSPPQPDPPPDTEWPRVPVTERDPWRDHLGGNPWGKDRWIPRIFVQAIRDEGFMSSGFVISEAFGEDDKVVQYFERKRWEWNRDGSVTAGLVGYEAMVARYPERRR